MLAIEVYSGSDGEVTKTYYKELVARGPIGLVGMNLFRAQKCSSRAKKYRGGIAGKGSYRDMAYERKQYSINQLCGTLKIHSEALGIRYGWKPDKDVVLREKASWVLYVDLPQGQVSFHTPMRGEGPDYPGEWDAQRLSAERILAFCDSVFANSKQLGLPEPTGLDGREHNEVPI